MTADAKKLLPLAIVLMVVAHTVDAQLKAIDAVDLAQMGSDGHEVIAKASDAVGTAYERALSHWYRLSNAWGPTMENIQHLTRAGIIP